MLDVLIRAAVIVGQVLLLWTALACLAAMAWSGYARARSREQRREREAIAAAWARQHGGDPEYQGGLGGRRQQPRHLEVVYGSGAEQRLERAS